MLCRRGYLFFRDGNVVGVRFPDLPGCNTCGDDQEDALTMARDALGGHLLCLEDLGEATRVTESWTDDRRSWPDWLAWVFDHIVTRGWSFADFQRLNIRQTLTAMKDDVEKR